VIAKLATVVALSTAALPSTSPRLDGEGLPKAKPESVEMSALRLDAITRVVRRGISEGGFPGAAVVVGRRGSAVYSQGFGRISWGAGAQDVSPDRTVYDLASLTKVIGTTTAIMLLFDEGKLKLEDKVSTFFPEFSGGWKDSVTLRHLLTHRSGLPAGRDLWRNAWSPADAQRMVIDTPLEYEPGTHYVYSDLGADILGMIAERASGRKLDELLQERVFAPLGMTETWYRVPASVRSRTAPTATISVRGYSLQGDVHDENAHALGGVAGHAGLFSTASDLSVFATMMLNKGTYNGTRILSDSAVELFTARSAGSRALGWDTCAGHNGGGCGRYLSTRAFGHTGFTGTSIWIDPDRDMFVVLLTNRVFESRARRPERVIADVRADLADASAWAVTAPGQTVDLEGDPEFRADYATGWNPVPEVRYRPVTCGVSRGRALARRTAGRHASKSRRSSCRSSSTKGKSTVRAVSAKRGRSSAAARSRASASSSSRARKSGRTSASARGRSRAATASPARRTASRASASSRSASASRARKPAATKKRRR
jgi:CubicO group peptidase (beta-lactamase class C family)